MNCLRLLYDNKSSHYNRKHDFKEDIYFTADVGYMHTYFMNKISLSVKQAELKTKLLTSTGLI